MKYATICSGIGAPEVAWRPLGWECRWQSEIEPFPSAVLKHHCPDVPNLGDMTKLKEKDLEPVDLICTGTPCQSFSVAGLRKGMDDPRGNLTLVLCGIIDKARPSWVVWENVTGVLSSNGGRDFGAFLGALGELGYGFAYRVLDAQYVRVESHSRAVPQRRRRVFVVGYLGDWRRAAAVLFESESMSGHSPPSREAGKGITHDASPCIRASGQGFERTGETRGQDPVVPVVARPVTCGEHQRQDWETTTMFPVSGTLNASGAGTNRPAGQCNELDFCIQVGIDGGAVGFALRSNPSRSGDKGDGGMNTTMVAHSLKGEGFDASEDGTGRGTPIVVETFDTKGYPSSNHKEDYHAAKNKTNTPKILRELREEIGEKAFAEWGLGILYSLQSKEVLQPNLHGKDLRLPTFSKCWVVYCSLSCQKDCTEGALQSVRETLGERCSSFRWRLEEQRSIQLGSYMSELSQQEAQTERFMHDLRQADEGSGILQQALFKVQKIRRPIQVQEKPILAYRGVRRLTPNECELLMGFPDGHTAIKYRGKPAADSPRYKAIGNSMAVNVMRWIGDRIQMIEEIKPGEQSPERKING